MTTQQVLEHIRAKLSQAQTLLNAPAIALQEGRPAPSPTVRLALAEEAEDLIHDAADLFDAILLNCPQDAVQTARNGAVQNPIEEPTRQVAVSWGAERNLPAGSDLLKGRGRAGL